MGLGGGFREGLSRGHNALCSDGWNSRLPRPALEAEGAGALAGWPSLPGSKGPELFDLWAQRHGRADGFGPGATSPQ